MRNLGIHSASSAILGIACLTGCAGSKADGAASRANELNTFELLTAAAGALSAGRMDEAGFLLLASQMRFQIDKQVYPPVETGADSPDVLKSALSFSVGSGISSAMSQDPSARAKATKLLAAWSPKFGEKYDPGWKHKNPLQGNAIPPIVAAARKQILTPLETKAKLEEDPEYTRLSKELADARKFMAGVDHDVLGPKKTKLLGDLLKQYNDAQATAMTAANRLKEIEWRQIPESRWHAQVGWKAEDYFKDPQVVALCHAIEGDDVKDMEQLITAGADPNAIGKDGMTPLLWAFPDRKLERFACLLRHGANPNVAFASDFGVPNSRPFHPNPNGAVWLSDRGCNPGQTVTHLASRSPMTEYMRLVFANRGDANLVDQKTGDTPLNTVLENGMPDMQERVEILLKLKADPNHFSKWQGGYPSVQAVHANRFDIALTLLVAGADPTLSEGPSQRKLIDAVAHAARNLQYFPKEKVAEYQALVDELEKRGESLQAAKDRAKARNKK